MTESEEESSPEEGTAELGFQSRAHKLATLFIMTAGSANATRFPEMSLAHGGVPFMLAYLALLGAVAMPVMHLESSLAQFSEDGNRGIFSAVPLFIGLGYTMSLCAVVHILGDSVTLSQHLLHLVSSLRNFSWTGCPAGELVASDRTCYVAPAPLCSNVSARMAELFRRQQLDQGLPASGGNDGSLVVAVPARDYHHEAAGCIPGVYNPMHQSQPRRAGGAWDGGSFDEIRAQPLLSLATVWVLVFAVARHGLTNAKRFFYAMVLLHLVTTTMLLVRGAALPGGLGGLGMFFYADWGSVKDVKMWSSALYVCLESVGVTGSVYLGVARLNHFKNAYQEDVIFVLAADTASKGLRTVITFMFLGHLSATIGVDVPMLVDSESDPAVSILPQAMSAVPLQQFWTDVHSLWLVSTVLPKFLIVPDILLELLAASHPLVVANRTLVHFFLCALLITASTVICSPGGAIMASIFVHNHDRELRFLVLFLECVVVLQFCGLHRLSIISEMMTGRECSLLVKVCWTSVIPITVICVFYVEAIIGYKGASFQHPVWTYAVTAWLYLVQLSCIPVFAIVFMKETGLNMRDCLVPLPTWVPAAWDQAMVYRQLMVLEGMDTEARQKSPDGLRPRAKVPRRVATKKSESSSGSTEVLGSPHLFVAINTIPNPSSGNSPMGSPGLLRNPAAKTGSSVVPDSGTVHVSRCLSSIRRSMMRPKPPVEDVVSEATKSSVPAAASSEVSVIEPVAHQRRKTGSDRGASLVEGPYLLEAPPQGDNEMIIATLPAPGPKPEPNASDIPEEDLQNEKPCEKVQEVAVILQDEEAKRQTRERPPEKAVSKSKLSTKSTVTEYVATKRVPKAATASPGSGASVKKLAVSQEKRLKGHKMATESAVPLNLNAGKTGGPVQEEPRKALKRLKEGVVQRRKRRKHRNAASLPQATHAEQHEDARAPAPVSRDSDSARHVVIARAPSLSTIDRTTAFRSVLRNLLLTPQERANVVQRAGRGNSSKAVSKGRVGPSSAWFSLDTLPRAPSSGVGTQGTAGPGQGVSVPEREGVAFGGRGVSGETKASASLHREKPPVAGPKSKPSAPPQDAEHQARRKLKTGDTKHKASGSVQEQEHRRNSAVPSVPGSSRLRKPSGSQAESAFHASRAHASGVAAKETRPQTSLVVSARKKHSERAGAAGNTAHDSNKPAEGEKDKNKEGRQKPNHAET